MTHKKFDKIQKQIESGIKESGSVNKRTVDQARNYEENRFGKRARGRRLDKIDKDFARTLFGIIGNNGSVLDIPCGTGRFFDVFSKAKQLVMIDRDPSMLEVLQERNITGNNVQLIEGDITSIPINANSVDLCFSMRLFHHIDSEEILSQIVNELSRVSKRYVAFSFYNKNCWRYYSRKIRGKKPTGNYYSFGLISKLAQQTGLKLIQKKPKVNLLEQQCLVLFEKIESSI